MKYVNRKTITVLGSALVIVLSLTACHHPTATTATGLQRENQAQTQDSNNLDNNQPVPVYKFSQARQTLINAQDIEAQGENTTTFGYSNNGVVLWRCSSIGMPVPADAQLTNPEQPYRDQFYDRNGTLNVGQYTVPQPDPIGFYTGPTTGTYTLCVTPQGAQYLQYWEGYTDSVSGPASIVNGQVVLQGTPVSLKQGNK